MRSLWLLSLLWAQVPQILRFVPGRYRELPHHQIDLYNPADAPLSLDGWLLITREYSVRLPKGLLIRPRQKLRIAKRGGDLQLDGYPDFLIRIADFTQPGAYVALLDPTGRLRVGLYLAPLPQVLFLPDSGYNITREGRRIPFYLPSETAPVWEYVAWEPDPITGVVRIGQGWRYTVADPEKEAQLYAPLRFMTLLAAYEATAVHLVWEVAIVDRCSAYQLERYEVKGGWQVIQRFACSERPLTRQRMEYYDLRVEPNKSYRYRLVYEGGPSLRVESMPVEVTCRPRETTFRMEARPGIVRLWVAQSQPVKVRLLDSQFSEKLRLYDGWVNGGVENIFLWDTLQVRKGCWVVVWTPQRRYWERLCAR